MALSSAALAEALREGAHGDAGVRQVRDALAPLDLDDRLAFLNNNIVSPPIDQALANVRAGRVVDPFNVLQGDIVVTSAAYQLGVRQQEPRSYVVASSSCDLQAGRRETALLFPVGPKRRGDFATIRQARGTMKPLTLYTPNQYFYLPPLPDDEEEVIFNVAYLDPICTCTNEAVNLATRRASLTRFGWRLFGVIAREFLIREAEFEDAMRAT